MPLRYTVRLTTIKLFDSDGTLVDSEAINTEALADELALHNITEDKTSLLTRYRGWQFKALLDDLSEHHEVELNSHFETAFRARASDYFAEKLEPIVHIRESLQQLKHVKCVASNAPMNKLTQVLNKTELSKFFNGNLFSAYDISRFKPDPALFLHAAEQMGFNAENCIVIEDSEVGVQAAMAAAMKCVHYLPGGNDVANVRARNVVTISSMLELPSAIAQLELQN